MLVVSSNDFRTYQKKYLDLALKNEQVFIKSGKNTFLVSPVKEGELVRYNPEWVEEMEQSRSSFEQGNATVVDSPQDVWTKVRSQQNIR